MFLNYPTSSLRDHLSVISVKLIAILVRYFCNRVRVFVLEHRDYGSPKFFAPRVPDLKYDPAHSNWFFLRILSTEKDIINDSIPYNILRQWDIL